jgi:hypothetical protein
LHQNLIAELAPVGALGHFCSGLKRTIVPLSARSLNPLYAALVGP